MAETGLAVPSDEALQQILGYLNFSEGRPDPRFQQNVSDAWEAVRAAGVTEPWPHLHERLSARLAELHAAGAGAFRDVQQVDAVLRLTFDRVLPAYREHHRDLLFHLSDEELLQPFFVARVFEAVLTQGPLRAEAGDLVTGAIRQLNDYVGHRPGAGAVSRPRGEPYDHERVRPVPLYLRGAGVAAGRYQGLVALALEILAGTDPRLLEECSFDPAVLDELAFDPRAYDHGHPANRRPNYVFGEWDPHVIDGKGLYRRFVVRKLTLDAILAWADQSVAGEGRFEAAAVLAGVMLMGSGVSGAGPETHDSSVTLANLIPRIARNRDAFYVALIARVPGPHGDRLRAESAHYRQPFGAARQHLNQFLARHRAAQMQQRHLALFLAELGYPEASRRHAARIPAASVRLLAELHVRLTSGRRLAERGGLADAARLLSEVEDLLHRGIACGALADPWNVLGFGGLYPLFQAMEDSVRDPRIEELVSAVGQTFNLYAQLRSETAAAGQGELGDRLARDMKRLASWWDRFATYEVSDVRRVHGGEATASADHVATALRSWRERGEGPADLGFWRQHLEGFRSAKSYALVVDALLRKEDYRAAMGLLMHWLSQADQVPLEDGEYSFHGLSMRWMLGLCRALQAQRDPAEAPPASPPEVVARFFDYLEANAEDYWAVPRLELLGIPVEQPEGEGEPAEDDEEDVYGAAYEDMTYQDSTDDDVESEVLEVGPQPDFDLEAEGERIEKHLRFLATVARLWNVATRTTAPPGQGRPEGEADPLARWLDQAVRNNADLLELLNAIHEHPIPRPSGQYESLVEFDRRRVIKDRLLHVIIATTLDNWLAMGALRGRRGGAQKARGWKADLYRLEDSLWRGDAPATREAAHAFLHSFQNEPLLFAPLSGGGHPRLILRASRAQTILRAMAQNLPRLGLLPETLLVARTAHEMEQRQPLQGQRVTEFDRLFQVACQSAAEAVVEAAADPSVTDDRLVGLLERLIQPYVSLWREHSRTLRVAMLEVVTTTAEWDALVGFVKTYGKELFQVRFMSLGNLRGILHRGIKEYLTHLKERPDPLHPLQLLEDLDVKIAQPDAERHLRVILQTVVENYETYKDYNATAPQSDYGENLHILFDFLRLRASYERQAWQFRPLVHVHEVLARRRPSAAVAWQRRFTHATAPLADQHLRQLAELEKRHGIKLSTVTDRLRERFVKPLALDRLCALIEPAMNAAGTSEADAALARLEEALHPYAEHPTGVGLDTPHWLQRVEGTLHQLQAARTAVAGLAEDLLQIPRVPLTLPDLERQLADTSTVSSSSNFWGWMTTLLTPVASTPLPGPPPKT